MKDEQTLIALTASEQRILGSLIEKSRTTPDYYPMTVSALTNACNQKTSRNPVVSYDEEIVTLTLNSLKIKGLVSTATGGGSRVIKYKHNLGIAYPLVPAELAIVCLLLLRGPLTPGEINTNSARLYDFETIEEIQDILLKLSAGAPAYVQQMERKPGQKEARYRQLFGESTAADTEIAAPGPHENAAPSNLEERVLRLEKELEEMKEMLNLLMG